jgi:quercetin dioxygenase-like cupin family protein
MPLLKTQLKKKKTGGLSYHNGYKMAIKNSPENAPRVSFNIDGRIMHSGKKVESILLTLQPGELIPAHTNPFDVLIICISGMASIKADEQSFTLDPCETLFVSADAMRQMQNPGSEALKVMVVKIF